MSDHPLSGLLARLSKLSPLDAEDRASILALPHQTRNLRAHEHIVRQGSPTENFCLVRTGFAIRFKIVVGGARQIVSLHMAGDLINVQNALLPAADHNIQALTPTELTCVPGPAISALTTARPAVAVAMWLDALIDGSIFREWIVNVGRRDAKTRTAHLLCEIALRQEAAGLAARTHYDLPLTQEQLGDALGLTPVHINRTLRALENAGLIERWHRSVKVRDWAAMQTAADFDPNYLHLEVDPSGPSPA